jgi:hypothetical protein
VEDVKGSACTDLKAANRAAEGEGGGKGFEQKDLEAAYKNGYETAVKDIQEKRVNTYVSWKEWARQRAAEPELLSDWEYDFFSDFACGRFAKPTVRQRAIFARVAGRLDLVLPESHDPQGEMFD